ncbi:protein TolQ [Aliidiomarina halalkaliphila]|uniref:Tol-Pal system protein TolQ n=1 Tax=Aliidiomarina halalkaliphila TaxID=2593535 RepID=A0A552X5H4_9GAMM|nr:protein TolQ [Aliidiomarina halalkaliphila]TRW50258.1 protein TolQ [Aliidiomarina halalkaliphila]
MEAELSFFDLFLEASLVVQLVMILLVLMSILSWALIFQRRKILQQAEQEAHKFEERFWSGVDLAKLYKEVSAKGKRIQGTEHLFHSGFREFARLRQVKNADGVMVMAGTQRAMRVAHSREMDRLETHLSVLATIGSISPYVGLFGTVWGIMNAFIALGSVQQATLQMVAPGIAEALVATAMGLFAAIPAVIAYNKFSSQIGSIDGNYINFAEEFTSILQRQTMGGAVTSNSPLSQGQEA